MDRQRTTTHEESVAIMRIAGQRAHALREAALDALWQAAWRRLGRWVRWRAKPTDGRPRIAC